MGVLAPFGALDLDMSGPFSLPTTNRFPNPKELCNDGF